MKYRIIRTHVETYVIDDVEARSKEEAINKIKAADYEAYFDHVESSAYEYEAIEENKIK